MSGSLARPHELSLQSTRARQSAYTVHPGALWLQQPFLCWLLVGVYEATRMGSGNFARLCSSHLANPFPRRYVMYMLNCNRVVLGVVMTQAG